MLPVYPSLIDVVYSEGTYKTDLEKYYTAVNSNPVDETSAQRVRNQIAFGLKSLIDRQYAEFRSRLLAGQGGIAVAGDTSQLGLTAAATIARNVATKGIFAALATGITGLNLSIDKNYFQQQSYQVLIVAMDTARSSVSQQLVTGLGKTVESYPVTAMQDDLVNYLFAGSLPGGFAEIQREAGVANANQPAPTPGVPASSTGITLISLSPPSGQQGQTINNVTVTGQSTHFTDGVTALSFSGKGVSGKVSSVTDNTHLLAAITIADTSSIGNYNVTATTGAEVATGTGLFTVKAGTPSITTLSTTTGSQAQTISNVIITGQFTHFTSATPTISFGGAGVTGTLVSVTDNTHLVANIIVSATAATGSYNVTVTTGSEAATGPGLFTVTPGLPSITTLSTPSGQQGRTVNNVSITGQFTHFTAAAPSISFSGAGVSAAVVNVVDNTHLVANVTVSPSAALGTYNVTVTTAAETAVGSGLFSVTAGTPIVTALSSASIPQAQTINNVTITGQFTHFTSASPAISFGVLGVTGTVTSVTDNTHLIASISVAPNVMPGTYAVTVTTGAEVATGAGLLTVTAGLPAIVNVTPAAGQQGQTITNVAVTGQFTHFTAAAPSITFSGAGVSGSVVSVTDNTHLVANITIAPDAATGAYNVTVSSGGESAVGPSLLSVNAK